MNKTEEMKKVRDDVLAVQGGLSDLRRKGGYFPVVGEGSHDSNIVFVGEAPGKNEAQTGRPFCGASGKMLDSLLDSINLPRDKVYITNIVKDRPPENRDPLPSEIELYGPFLDKQLNIIKPKIIATLGRFSMEYILKKFGLDSTLIPISQAHGKIFKANTDYGEVIILPLYHPAAAIYNQHLKSTLQEDFKILEDLC